MIGEIFHRKKRPLRDCGKVQWKRKKIVMVKYIFGRNEETNTMKLQYLIREKEEIKLNHNVDDKRNRG